MKLEVSILGAGSATPTLKRRPTSQLLNINENYILLDCGEGTQLQLRKFNKKLQRINHIFISHLHGDHYFGLVGLLSTFNLLGRSNSLSIFAHEDLRKVVELQMEVSKSYLKYPIEWFNLRYDEKSLILDHKHFTVHSFPLKHRISCCGFLIEEKDKPRNIIPEMIGKYQIPIARIRQIKAGADFLSSDGRIIPNEELTIAPAKPKSYAFCSDTIFRESIAEYFTGVNCLYHEATFLEKDKLRAKETYHSTAAQAASIARCAGAKQLLIGHFSARYTLNEEFLEEAKSIFENTLLAEEGMDILIA